jgi:mRNA interferase RelE/StbE
MYSVEWKRKAVKQLRKIDRTNQPQIIADVGGLANWPNCPNVKHLTNHQYEYRLRVGRYRVFFNVHETIEVIHIEEVKKRDGRTY